MDNNKLIHPHDKFFKDAFSRINVIRSFVEYYLFPEDKAIIDPLTLEAVRDTHINPELQELFSDMVYAGLTPDGSERVYLLFEHKSYPDRRVGVQLQENIAMVLQYHQRQHGRESIPIVLSIVIGLGQSVWDTGIQPVYHFVPYEKHRRIFPDLQFTVIDLSAITNDQIRGVAYLRILFLTLKYIHNPGLPEKIKDIIVIFKELNDDPEAPEYFKVLMKYLEGTTKENLFLKLQDKIKRTLNEGGDQMSRLLEGVLEDIIKKRLEETAAKSRQEGWREGLKIGEERGIKQGIEKEKRISTLEIAGRMISNGLNDEITSKVTGLTLQQVQKLRNGGGAQGM
ncbi:MAG: Rpn family recombination-promoting nuclease/putative transposase [Fibrobacter sp.]|nr:Rpn family recombination-promoting nuclease/putative transposase [Fibrobacter sp.]